MSIVTPEHNSVKTHPIERILPQLKGIKTLHNGRGYSACCPAHGDSHQSLTIWEDGPDRTGLCCFAGCSQEAVLESIGLTWQDLYRDKHVKMAPKSGITLLDLAADKLIHPRLLASLGITDGHTDYGKQSVHIPYHTQDGKPYERYRIRNALAAKAGSFWSDGEASLIPYGLEMLVQARAAGYLVIVEGESDCWTLWAHSMPALGVPGAKLTSSIELQQLEGIERVYIMRESDKAGRQFADDLYKHLQRIGYKGKPYLLALDTKDPNELHKRDIKAFKATFEQAIAQARPLFRERQKPKLQRLRDLQLKELPETRWAIEPILPEGVTILGGKPKLGKSWLALAILAAIASGGVALGQYPVEQGEVLYIDLEDGEKRLKNRANTFLHDALAADDFYYITDCPRIDEGGLDFLTETIDERPGLRLICIDTWARFKPRPRGRVQVQYDEDYDALQPLQRLASDKGISILVVDHMRKMESEDPIDQISGSVGKTGAVDGFLLLYRKRQETDAHLFVIGRDIEQEQDLMLSFSHECASWIVKGEADSDTVAATPERQAILDLLQESPEGLTYKEIAKALGKNENTTRNLLAKMRDKIYLENRRFTLMSMRSQHSNDSQRSQRSQRSQEPENVDKPPGLTTPDYGLTTAGPDSVVSTQHLADMPVEPIQSNGNGHLTTLTTLTTLAPKEKLPAWLIPGTWDWKKLVERVGLQEVNERRQSALKAAEVHL